MHVVYVKLPGPGDPDTVSREVTTRTLTYLQGIQGVLREMGIRLVVEKVTSAALRHPEFTAALKRRGIVTLPALLTTRNVHNGYAAIVATYTRNIAAYRAVAAKYDEMGPLGAAGDDPLSAYYGEIAREPGESFEETAIGSGADMMGDLQAAIARREAAHARPGAPAAAAAQPPAGRAHPPPGRAHPPAQTPGRAGAPPGAAPARGDNVPTAPGADDDILGMIDRISRLPLEEGEERDSRDDVMLRAYWEGRSSETPM